MRARRVAFALVVSGALSGFSCSPRPHGLPQGNGGPSKLLEPLPPPPPGSVVVHGPLVVEAVDPVRAEIGWDRELVRASRLVTYDVVVSQLRATCPEDVAPKRTADAMGCLAIADAVLPASCTSDTVHARIEVTVTYGIEVQQRCAGDGAPYAVPEAGDPKQLLAGHGSACFSSRNKFKPEATWTSLYALTELSIVEKPLLVVSDAAPLVGVLLDPASPPRACRDDGVFLDGTPGADAQSPSTATTKSSEELAHLLSARGPLPGEGTSLGVTGGAFRTEQELWEACRPAAPLSPTDPKNQLLPALRCQLLRQLDRFVREVEDAARPQTPKGASAAPSTSGSSGTGTVKP